MKIKTPRELEIERKKIDNIDRALVLLLELRMDTVTNIKDIKTKHNFPILDKSRETIILSKMDNIPRSTHIKEVFLKILEQSKKAQEELK
jgi:maltose O-acetyltransferase